MKFYDNTGKFLYKIRKPRQGDGELLGPNGLCLQKCGNHHNVLVCDKNNGRVDQYTLEGCFAGKRDKKFQRLKGIATTPNGLILVSDFRAKQIFFLK